MSYFWYVFSLLCKGSVVVILKSNFTSKCQGKRAKFSPSFWQMVGRIPSLRWFLVSTFVVLQVKLVSLKSKGTTKHQQGGKRNAEFHQAHVIYQKRINEPYNSSTTQPKLLCHHRVKPHLHNHDEPSSKLNVIPHCITAHYSKSPHFVQKVWVLIPQNSPLFVNKIHIYPKCS